MSSSAVGFAANLQRSVDKVVQQAGDPKPECKLGCAWCCSLLVEAMEPEIFLIAREIRKRAPEEVQAIVETLRARAAATQDDANNLRRRDCAFLKNKRCSIYEVRPSTCRKPTPFRRKAAGILPPKFHRRWKYCWVRKL